MAKSRTINRNAVLSDVIYFTSMLTKEPFSLDKKAYNLFRHTSNKHQIFIFFSGDCKMETDEYSHLLQPGDVCFNPAFSYYWVNILENTPYERIVLSIPPSEHFDKFAFEVFNDLRPINVNVKELLLPFLQRYNAYRAALPAVKLTDLANNMLEELLYICLMQKRCEQDALDPAETLLKKALEYIELRWDCIKSIKEISNTLFISPSYLYEIFNKKLNMTPKEYLMQKRLQTAHAYLSSGISPNEVSSLVGFNTYTAFYRAFKAFYGKTPKEVFDKKK